MHISKWVVAILISGSASAQQQQAAGDGPQRAIREFYQAYRGLKISGLPAQAELARLSPYSSAGLQALIHKARVEQARCAKAHPGDKGPWVEGDLFSSNFEGFTGFQVGPAAGALLQRVPVEFEYVENGRKFTWKDEVSVVKEGGRWLVDNVHYRKSQGFGNGFGASLRASLSAPGCTP